MDDDTANGQTLPCLAALTLAAYSLAALSFFLVSEIRQRRTHGDAASRGRVVLDAHTLYCSPRRRTSDGSATASAILC